MKKIYTLLVAVVLFLVPIVSYANEPIKINVNGEYVETDSDAFIEEGRTMVPIRFISEALGYNVYWNEDTLEVTIENEEHILVFTIGEARYELDGLQYEMDIAPKLINSRTYLPIRYVGEAFDINVDWDAKHWTVILGIGYIPPDEVNDFKEAIVINVNDVNNMVLRIDGIEQRVIPIGIQVNHSKISELQYFNPSIIYTRKLLEGRTVYLESDRIDRDNSGNLFRYIWVERPARKDATVDEAKQNLFNALILSENLAQISPMQNNNKYLDLFKIVYLNAQKSSAL